MEKKKRLTYITIVIFFFFSGVEYAVILPTMWLYINTRFGAPEYFLGFMLSAFSAADLICSPIYGKFSDVTRHVKILIIVSNMFEVMGNLMYTMGVSIWFLLGSRLVSGCGAGSGAAIVAEITRTTSQSERTGIIALVMACRQLGLVIGPACNFFLREINFTVGPFTVDKYSSPGLFMAVLWLAHQFMVIFCYTDFVKFDANQTDPKHTTIVSPVNEQVENENVSANIHDSSLEDGNAASSRSRAFSFHYYINEFVRDEIVAILATVFAAFFNQTALETMVTPVTQKYLYWGELENSIMYAAAGVEIIVVFFVVRILSRRFSDRSLLLVGSGISVLGLVWLIVFFPRATPGQSSNLPLFIVGVATDVLSLPFLVTCAVSLYSKLTRRESQGMSQGVRRSVLGLATILGPLWAGSLINNLYVMLGVLIFLMVFTVILLMASWPRLSPPEEEEEEEEALEPEADERTRLLSNDAVPRPQNYETALSPSQC